MIIISTLITLLAGLIMFAIKRYQKLIILIIGSICCDSFRLGGLSFSQFEVFVSFCFFLSELKSYKFYLSILRKTPLIKIECIVIIGALATIFFSSHLRSINSISGFIITELIAKYFIITYSFVGLRDIKTQLYRYIKIVYLCILILTFFAILNFTLGYPIWLDIIGITVHSSSRLRLYGMFQYTFDYGFICIVGLLTFVYCRNKLILTKKQVIVGLICCSFGILLCGSRTVFVCGVGGLGLYLLMLNSLAKNIKIAFLGFMIVVLALFCIPALQEHLRFLMSAFDSDSDVTGSSLGMRATQYLTVLLLITESPWVGRGYHYFFYDLGWSEGVNVSMLPYPELAGLEGALMGTLLERGLIGVVAYILFYWCLIRYALKLKRKNRLNEEVYLVISILVSFVVYGNMTGELNSAPAALLYAGLFLKAAYIKKYCNGCICDNSKL